VQCLQGQLQLSLAQHQISGFLLVAARMHALKRLKNMSVRDLLGEVFEGAKGKKLIRGGVRL